MKRNAKAQSTRVKEEPSVYSVVTRRETSNVQRSTSNVQVGKGNAAAQEIRYDLDERLLDYAVRIIRLVDALPATRAGRHVADQLLRCGTSPLANHGELQAAESRNDFIHKLGICLKEIREAHGRLRLHESRAIGPREEATRLRQEANELVSIMTVIVANSRAKASVKPNP